RSVILLHLSALIASPSDTGCPPLVFMLHCLLPLLEARGQAFGGAPNTSLDYLQFLCEWTLPDYPKCSVRQYMNQATLPPTPIRVRVPRQSPRQHSHRPISSRTK